MSTNINSTIPDHSYPSQLLPDPDYNKIAFTKAHGHLWLLRSTENSDYWDDDIDKLKVSAVVLQTDHLRDYSTNLLGVFKPKDRRIQYNKGGLRFEYLIEEWQEGINVDPPLPDSDFVINETRGCFYLLIGDINEREMRAYDDGTNVKPVCRIKHTPTNSNFWHCSLRWYYNEMDTICWQSKERRRILSTAKTFVVEHAKKGEPTYEAIDPSYYHS